MMQQTRLWPGLLLVELSRSIRHDDEPAVLDPGPHALAGREVAKIILSMPDAEQQEAFGEALFYGGAYARYVKGNEADSRAMLDRLNHVAPYGSVEWVYGKRVLN
ncbi:hypothetical protein PQR14_13815 [Paraburkholderia bryophila]|uniref:hypothetical protein n=1 Tax=Paraburkholderia bryophila TaxID=420952 RepID=UPI0038B8184D